MKISLIFYFRIKEIPVEVKTKKISHFFQIV